MKTGHTHRQFGGSPDKTETLSSTFIDSAQVLWKKKITWIGGNPQYFKKHNHISANARILHIELLLSMTSSTLCHVNSCLPPTYTQFSNKSSWKTVCMIWFFCRNTSCNLAEILRALHYVLVMFALPMCFNLRKPLKVVFSTISLLHFLLFFKISLKLFSSKNLASQ